MSGEREPVPAIGAKELALLLIADAITRDGREGSIVCPNCGAELDYVVTAGGGLSGSCDTCRFRVSGFVLEGLAPKKGNGDARR